MQRKIKKLYEKTYDLELMSRCSCGGHYLEDVPEKSDWKGYRDCSKCGKRIVRLFDKNQELNNEITHTIFRRKDDYAYCFGVHSNEDNVEQRVGKWK